MPSPRLFCFEERIPSSYFFSKRHKTICCDPRRNNCIGKLQNEVLGDCKITYYKSNSVARWHFNLFIKALATPLFKASEPIMKSEESSSMSVKIDSMEMYSLIKQMLTPLRSCDWVGVGGWQITCCILKTRNINACCKVILWWCTIKLVTSQPNPT